MNTLYQCGICKQIYPTSKEAQACEDRGNEQIPFKVGDFVSLEHDDNYGRFSWFDGDPNWVSSRTKGLHGTSPSFALIYVVTAITYNERPHEARIHLVTKGMSGTSGYRSGWTVMKGHYTPRPFNPSIELDASDLVAWPGLVFSHLLS